MTAAPDRGGLTRPAPEGAAEGADLGDVQDFSNLAEGQVRLGEQRAGNLAADLVGDLPKRAAFGFQVSVQGPAGHRVEAGDHVRRTGIPDVFDPKRALHLLGERASAMRRLGKVCPAGRRHFHRISLARPEGRA